jgi:hypothetical protein
MALLNVWPTDAPSVGAVTSEARWRAMARTWAISGVVPGIGLEMEPTLAAGTITVKAGACWVDGHYCELTTNQNLTATVTGLIVVRFDPVANTAELLYRDGVTTPTQTLTGVYELVLGRIGTSVLVDLRSFISTGAGAYCTVGCTADYAIPGPGPDTVVPFDGPGTRDISGDLIRAVTAGGGIHVVRGGLFLVSCQLDITVGNGVDVNIGPALYRGGVAVISFGTNIKPVGTGLTSIRCRQTPGSIVSCHAGDEIKILASKPAGTNGTVHAYPYSHMDVSRVGSQSADVVAS